MIPSENTFYVEYGNFYFEFAKNANNYEGKIICRNANKNHGEDFGTYLEFDNDHQQFVMKFIEWNRETLESSEDIIVGEVIPTDKPGYYKFVF